jgi:hypothetical protein
VAFNCPQAPFTKTCASSNARPAGCSSIPAIYPKRESPRPPLSCRRRDPGLGERLLLGYLLSIGGK